MAITLIGSNWGERPTFGGAPFTVPSALSNSAAIQAGDLILLAMNTDDDTPVSVSGAFTKLYQNGNNADAFFARVATGAETAGWDFTVTGTAVNEAWAFVVYRGATIEGTPGGTGAFDYPWASASQTSVAAELAVLLRTNHSNIQDATMSAPAGMTEQVFSTVTNRDPRVQQIDIWDQTISPGASVSYSGTMAFNAGYYGTTLVLLVPSGGGGGGPSTDQVPLDAAASTKAPAVSARRLVEVVAPVGALLAAGALTSIAWGASPALPARAQQLNPPTIQAIAPIGTGTFRLPASPQNYSVPQGPITPIVAQRVLPSEPIGTRITTAALSSIAWANPTPLPARALGTNRPVESAVAPVGTGTFRLSALPNSGFAAQDPRAPTTARSAIEPTQPLGQLAVTLSSIGWLQIDTAAPRSSTRLTVVYIAGDESPGLSLPWFDSYLETRPSSFARQPLDVSNPFGAAAQASALSTLGWQSYEQLRSRATVSASLQPSSPVGALLPGALTSLGWLGVEPRTAALPAPRAPQASAPTGPLTPFLSVSTGFFGSSSASPVLPAPRAQEAQQPTGPLRPFVSASSGFQTVDAKAPPALAPRVQEASQPTGPLAPFVSRSSGWDSPVTARQSTFSARAEASAPVGSLIQSLTSLGWMGADTRAPVLPAPRAQDAQQPSGPLRPFLSPSTGWFSSELILDQPLVYRQVSESSPNGTLLTPQPFGWNSAIDQARPAAVVSRRVEPAAPIGTAFAIALPSNGWLATDNPRTPLTLGKSTPQDPVGNLLVLPPLPNLTWLTTENPRTPYSVTRAVIVDPVGSKFFVPPALGPYWFIDQPRTPAVRTSVADTVAPVGTLFATLTSVGWLSPFEAPRSPLVAQRVQPVDLLRGLQFGGAPWSTVDVQPGRAAVARAPEVAQPTGPLAPFVSTSIGWQSASLQQQPSALARRFDASAPIGALIQSGALTSLGWQLTDQPRTRIFVGAPVDTTLPIGALLTQGLSSIGWYWSDTAARPTIVSQRQQESVSPVSALTPFVSLSSGWQTTEQQRTRQSTGSTLQPVQAHSALAFGGAPWASVDPAQPRALAARGQESAVPIGVAFSQSLANLGWLTTETIAPRLVFPRVNPIEPVGLFMPPPVLPGMGWNYVMELPPRWSFVARPVPSEPVGSSFALGFSVAPIRRCSPVFDLTGVGRLSPIFDETR